MGYTRELYKFEWDSIDNLTNQAPARSYKYDLRDGWVLNGTADMSIKVVDAESIALQIDPDNLSASHASTDFDINVIACLSELDAKYDDGVDGIYWEINGDLTGIKTRLVSPGPERIKLRLDENMSERADVRVYVLVRKRLL
jgi:hypothetical protein